VGAIGGSTRSGQQEMAQAVASAVDKGIHLLVQAGTGTGKSLAYLVPAAEYATRTGGKGVVSTATLALQTQIIHRDLPRLLKAVKKDLDPLPRAALLKGRRNYVCKHKLAGGYPDEGEGMLFDLGADAEAGRKPTERSGLGRRSNGSAPGRRPPTPATATTSCPASATAPGHRCPSTPSTASV